MDSTILIRCSTAEKAAWKKAAGRAGTSAWMRSLANTAARPATRSATRGGKTEADAVVHGLCPHRRPLGAYCRECAGNG